MGWIYNSKNFVLLAKKICPYNYYDHENLKLHLLLIQAKNINWLEHVVTKQNKFHKSF
jgi:hypothetical protein